MLKVASELETLYEELANARKNADLTVEQANNIVKRGPWQTWGRSVGIQLCWGSSSATISDLVQQCASNGQGVTLCPRL